MADHDALVADRAVALADVEEIHAVAVLAQVHVDIVVVDGDALHQGTHDVVNLHAFDGIALDADVAAGGVGIELRLGRNLGDAQHLAIDGHFKLKHSGI